MIYINEYWHAGAQTRCRHRRKREAARVANGPFQLAAFVVRFVVMLVAVLQGVAACFVGGLRAMARDLGYFSKPDSLKWQAEYRFVFVVGGEEALEDIHLVLTRDEITACCCFETR